MTTETIARFIFRQAAAQRLLQRFRNRARRANRKIQSFNLTVKTHEAFIISAFVLKHVSLAGLALSESVEDRQPDGLLAVRDRVKALFILALDLIRIGAAAKRHDRVFSQYF